MHLTIHYQNHKIRLYHRGQGPKILFLHGWPTNSRLWDAQVESLALYYHVYTLDWLGFGRSDKPPNHHYSFSSKKEILDTCISNILIPGEQISIVAHDIGGPPAILWASVNPQKLSHLILLNTIVFPFKTPVDALGEFILSTPIFRNILINSFGLLRFLHYNIKSHRTDTTDQIHTILAAHHPWPKRVRWKTIVEPMHTGRKNEILDLAAKFKELNVAKYLVIARKDPLCYAHMKRLSRDNPHVPAYWLDDCGHFIPLDQPEVLRRLLREILEK